MTVAAIIQARVRSTRLPAKTLLPLPNGNLVIEEVIHRCQQIEGVDVVAVAVPDSGDVFERVLQGAVLKSGAVLVTGSEHDVLGRYAKAAHELGADVIMRITSDCPLLSPQVCGEVLKLQDVTGADYASNCWPARHFPHGWDCEVFTAQALRRANAEATEAYDREHVTPFIQRHSMSRSVFLKAMEDRSHIRWTLDTIDDYAAILTEFYVRSGGIAA